MLLGALVILLGVMYVAIWGSPFTGRSSVDDGKEKNSRNQEHPIPKPTDKPGLLMYLHEATKEQFDPEHAFIPIEKLGKYYRLPQIVRSTSKWKYPKGDTAVLTGFIRITKPGIYSLVTKGVLRLPCAGNQTRFYAVQWKWAASIRGRMGLAAEHPSGAAALEDPRRTASC